MDTAMFTKLVRAGYVVVVDGRAKLTNKGRAILNYLREGGKL
jgi:hypothetical protein